MRTAIAIAIVVLTFIAGCGEPPRTTIIDSRDNQGNPNGPRWNEPPSQIEVEEPVLYVERSATNRYELPSGQGQAIDPIDQSQRALSSVADLLGILPQEAIAFSEPNLFTSERNEPECDNGRVEVTPDLPMLIDGVVTLHPRQYTKVPVCDQDERNYGTYTIEDDTGGIVVLRDSRVAWFQSGDRVRLTVDAAMLTYTGPESRAILTATIEPIGPVTTAEQRVIYYTTQPEPFTLEDITQTQRVEGFVAVKPTNKNFSTMVVANKALPVRTGAELNEVCRSLCAGPCTERCQTSEPSICRDEICPAVCEGADNDFDENDVANLPLCWEVNLDVELARRGYTYEIGTPITVTGPVVESYGLKIWVMRLGQIEVRDE